MEHPFIGDLSDKTLEDLQDTINTLNNKLMFAQRMGRHDMIRQMQMVIESYRSEYSRRQSELWDQRQQKYQDKIQVN